MRIVIIREVIKNKGFVAIYTTSQSFL